MILNEDVSLSKGSTRIMADKNLVDKLADAVVDEAIDARTMTRAKVEKAKADPEFNTNIARQFLSELDDMEKQGYEGAVYSRDGVNNDWLVRRFIAGSHTKADILSKGPKNLSDWYLLKNRNILDDNHIDLPKFNSVNTLGQYIQSYYKDVVEQARHAAANAARNKLAKSIKLVDNDDYRIYTTLNRAAGCALGLGTTWCTSQSTGGGMMYHKYSDAGMVFQVFPYKKTYGRGSDKDNARNKEGGKIIDDSIKFQFDATTGSFMDSTDKTVNPSEIATIYPYMYSDLSSALLAKKDQMEAVFAELSIDPKLQHQDFKIKTYDILKEIKKLGVLMSAGYFTRKVRPSTPLALSESNKFKGNIMKNVDKDVAAMMTSLKKLDKLTESVAPVLMARPKVVDEEQRLDAKCWDGKHKEGTKMKGGVKVNNCVPNESMNEKKGGKPQWLIDAEMKAEKKEAVKEDDCDENPWRKLADKEDKKSKTVKTPMGMKHEKDYEEKEEDKEEMNESVADQDVLAWMQRFSKLGNMKGYGR